MCGIFFSCNLGNHRYPDVSITQRLERRGPDDTKTVSHSMVIEPSRFLNDKQHPMEWSLVAVSSVLSLRGDTFIRQPIQNAHSDPLSDSFLCWNGEAWKVDSTTIQGSDADVVFDLLTEATKPKHHSTGKGIASIEISQSTLQATTAAISSIAGPFAFVFYDALNHRIFYGRDLLGRRSLLINMRSNGCLEICSVSSQHRPHEWKEVEADGVYVIDFTSIFPRDDKGMLSRQNFLRPLHVPWTAPALESQSRYVLVRDP